MISEKIFIFAEDEHSNYSAVQVPCKYIPANPNVLTDSDLKRAKPALQAEGRGSESLCSHKKD